MTTEFSRLDSALNVAKAMAQVAEASNPNFEGLLDKMGSIVPLMKHPDIRVKLALGRNLRRIEERSTLSFWMCVLHQTTTLSSGAPERLYRIDPEGWRRALENARALEMDHPHDVQYQEVVEILEVILGEDPMVLQVSQPLESDTRTALLPKVLQIDGVVSVTFEEGYIIVATRFVSTADPGFLSKLLKVVSDQGVHGANFFSVGEATGAVAATPFTASGAGSSSTSSFSPEFAFPADSAVGSPGSSVVACGTLLASAATANRRKRCGKDTTDGTSERFKDFGSKTQGIDLFDHCSRKHTYSSSTEEKETCKVD
eukprot:g29685.t1